MVASAANVYVKYRYDASSDSSPVAELSVVDGKPEMPEIYLVVGGWAYFADSSGYLVMYPIRPEMVEESEMPDLSDVFDGSEIPESSRSARFWAVNARWYDESEYGALLPEVLIVRNEWVCSALTAMHRMTENYPNIR